MRNAAWLERPLAISFWIASSGCLPQQELAAYSAGTEPSGASALAPPLTAAGESRGGVLPAVEAAADSAESPEPSDTPVGADGPPQPEQLAPAAAAPAESPAAPAEAPEPPPEPAPAAPAAPGMAPAEPPPEAPPPVAPPAPAADGALEPAQVRFVRLVADSEFNGGPLSTAAELEVFGADGQLLDRTGWVATADSTEPTFFGGAPAALAIDGQPASVWYTAWFQLAAPPPHPHFLQIDMGQPRTVTGFRYLARQDASVGRIADYRFFVSADGVEWGEPILAGRLQDSAQPQDVRTAGP